MNPIIVCKQCGNSWWRRIEKPVKCPACQSRNWDKPNLPRNLYKVKKGLKPEELELQ